MLTPEVFLMLLLVIVPPAETTPYALPSVFAIDVFLAFEVIFAANLARIFVFLAILTVLFLPVCALASAPTPPTKLPERAFASAEASSSVIASIVKLPDLELRVTFSAISIFVLPVIIASATDTPTATPP